MDKKKLEIGIAIVVIIGLIVVLFLVLRKPAEEGAGDQTTTGQEQTTRPTPERVTEVDARTVESPPDVIARSFVERFGSYSTDIAYANVEDVKLLATDSLQNQLDSLVATALSNATSGFYGVSTRVISIETVESNETAATLQMTTQRQETFDTPANTSLRYQDIQINLVKSGTRWLVSDFTWVE